MIQKRRSGGELAGIADDLRRASFFDGFSDAELARVAALAEPCVAEQGALLIDQGDVGLECYVILRGQAAIYVGGEHVATLGPGSIVGEMALVEHRPRNASVVAETAMRLLTFDTRAFRQLLDELPKAHDRVIALLLARMRPPAR